MNPQVTVVPPIQTSPALTPPVANPNQLQAQATDFRDAVRPSDGSYKSREDNEHAGQARMDAQKRRPGTALMGILDQYL